MSGIEPVHRRPLKEEGAAPTRARLPPRPKLQPLLTCAGSWNWPHLLPLRRGQAQPALSPR